LCKTIFKAKIRTFVALPVLGIYLLENWINELKRRAEKGLSTLDLPEDDRSFRPHLTMARVKSMEEAFPLMREIEKKQDAYWGRLPVDKIVLYFSELTAGEPVYSEIEHFSLVGRSK
jgi:2'-5' RNA ligase